jgi:peptide deformylase
MFGFTPVGRHDRFPMFDNLKIIHYPDPRLKQPSAPVAEFNENLRQLVARMFELMRQAKGVGLAAPQVAQNIRLFILNATGQPEDDRVYVNPFLSEEEGCLSIPGLSVNVSRSKHLRIQAHDLQGNPIDQKASGYLARIWQHEFDHLNGTLLTDRMGPVAKLANRRLLRELEEKYASEHPAPPPKKSPLKDKRAKSR